MTAHAERGVCPPLGPFILCSWTFQVDLKSISESRPVLLLRIEFMVSFRLRVKDQGRIARNLFWEGIKVWRNV